jgi:UDP-glucose 4-epimerase
MGKPGHPRKYLPARNEVLHAFSDHSKARSVFGSKEQTGLDEGLARMASWAHSVTLKPTQGFTDIEISKNMPPSWLKYKAQASYVS